MRENLAYQWRLLTTGEAGHEQPWYYHIIVVAIGCFPASLFFIQGARRSTLDQPDQRAFLTWMLVLFAVVIIVFSAVTTKIVHYSSLAYLPLTYIAARGLDRILCGDVRSLSWLQTGGLLLVGLMLSALFCIIPLAFMNKQWLLSLPTFRDVYLRAALSRNVAWIGIEPFIGLVLLIGVVVAIVIIQRHMRTAIAVLYGSVVLTLTLFLPIVAPRIEAYTQGAALDFYESLQNTGQTAQPLSMKSYAYLFYTRKSPVLASTMPSWYICRVNNIDEWKTDSTKVAVDTTGAFVIFRRTLPLQQTRNQ
jgi:4-amino-4-deoxy-L-arabinose transferase-like glycosyltransferase